MKLFIITGLLLLFVSRGCVEDEDRNTDIDTVEYDAADVAVRTAITDWNEFLAASEIAVDDACVRISQAADKADDPETKHRWKLKSAIIKSEKRMDNLSSLLLSAKKIKQDNYHFDDGSLEDIESFKKEFKNRQIKCDEALADMELLYKN